MSKHHFLTTAIVSLMALGSALADTAPPAPFPPLPSPQQLHWHEAENIMFVHWGMKTFHPSGNHMGTGTEPVDSFNPTKLDLAQWAKVAKESGFKGIVFTTKHHDGFCSWQTETTPHSVKSTKWANGKGDIVRDLSAACRKEGLYFGIYVSIKDNYYQSKVSKSYEGYSDYYIKQIEELSKNYGKVDEYWFDGFGANHMKIDYEKIANIIRKEQPNAVVYDSGTLARYLPDRCLRWPGNHGGIPEDQVYVNQIPGAPAGTLAWYPSEPSLILQGNWFHHGQPAVGVETMKNYYMQSVARSVTPLMNVSPNAEGTIDADTITKLKAFKAWVDDIHARDITALKGTKTTGSNARGGDAQFAPACATDDDTKSYFAPEDGTHTATIEVKFDKPRKVDGFIVQEPIALGQRIRKFVIECQVDGKWRPVYAGKTIGHKRVILEGRNQIPDLSFAEGDLGENEDADKILKDAKQQKAGDTAIFPIAEAARIRILDSGAAPLISNFQIIGDIAP